MQCLYVHMAKVRCVAEWAGQEELGVEARP